MGEWNLGHTYVCSRWKNRINFDKFSVDIHTYVHYVIYAYVLINPSNYCSLKFTDGNIQISNDLHAYTYVHLLLYSVYIFVFMYM